MFHDTAMGRLFAAAREAAQREVQAVLERAQGNLVRAAHELGIHRRWLYRVLSRERMWPAVVRARSQAVRRHRDNADWLLRTRTALRG